VAAEILQGVDTAASVGTRLAAHCPFHLEATPGGAFFYNFAEDCGHCHSCGQTGDLLDVWCALQGSPLRDADAFRAFRDRFAPGEAGRRQPLASPGAKPLARPSWSPRVAVVPPVQWSDRAASWVRHSAQRLLALPQQLAELEGLGLPRQAVEACMLGWNDAAKYPPVTSWGLPYATGSTGKEAKIYLPEGLVIPYAQGGIVTKAKVRQIPGKDPKYWLVKGSFAGFSIYGRPESRAWLLIETERDAAMAWWWCRSMGIGAMATGSASARPDVRSAEILRSADLILNALDYDQAGAGQVGWWEQEFPLSVRWPVPPSVGKDPGDMAAAEGGEAVAAWAWSGVPSHVRKAMSRDAGRATRRQQAQQAETPPVASGAEQEQRQGASCPAPEPALNALELLRTCPTRRAVLVATAGRSGLGGCDVCGRTGTCGLKRQLSEALFHGPDAAWLGDWIEARGGQLAGWERI